MFVRFKNSIPAPHSAYWWSSGTHIPVQELAFALTDRSCAESSSRSSTPVVDWSLSQFRLRTLQGRSQRFFAYSMWKGKRGDYIQPCVSSTRSACYRSNIRGSDLSGELLTVLDDIVGGITKRLKMSLRCRPRCSFFSRLSFQRSAKHCRLHWGKPRSGQSGTTSWRS